MLQLHCDSHTALPSLPLLLLSLSAPRAGAIRWGSYHEHVKTSTPSPSSADDLAELVVLLDRTNQTIYGFTMNTCEEYAELGPLLNLTQHTNISILACMDSHEPLTSYCSDWLYPGSGLNDSRGVDWPRVAATLSADFPQAAGDDPNLIGLYIDDFTGMLPSPGHNTTWRGKTPYPTVPLSVIDSMRSNLLVGGLKFVASMYVSQLGHSIPGGHALGAIGEQMHVAFPPGASASVTLPLATATGKQLRRRGEAPWHLRLVVSNQLVKWLGQQKSPPPPDLRGMLMLTVSMDGTVLAKIDTATTYSPSGGATNCTTASVVEIELPATASGTGTSSSSSEVTIAIVASANATNTASAFTLSYIWGVAVVSGTEVVYIDPSQARYARSIPSLTAESTAPYAVVPLSGTGSGQSPTKHCDVALITASQEPTCAAEPLYSTIMGSATHWLRRQSVDVFTGHYVRVGLKWSLPASPASLISMLHADEAVGVDAALAWNLPLSLELEATHGGIFTRRSGSETYPLLLFYPGNDAGIPHFYQRYVFPFNTTTTYKFHFTSNKGRGGGEHFRKTVYVRSTTSGTVEGILYSAAIETAPNASGICTPTVPTTCPNSTAAPSVGSCTRICKGASGNEETLVVTPPSDVNKPAGAMVLVVELLEMTGVGNYDVLFEIAVETDNMIPRFESGADDALVKEMYDAARSVFVGRSMKSGVVHSLN